MRGNEDAVSRGRGHEGEYEGIVCKGRERETEEMETGTVEMGASRKSKGMMSREEMNVERSKE